jgi:hypothetical protein
MTKHDSFWNRPQGMAALSLIGAVTFFLLTEHRAHFFQWLPFLILMLCPLMHIFMHGRHGHNHERSESHDQKPADIAKDEAYQRGLVDGRNQSLRDRIAK